MTLKYKFDDGGRDQYFEGNAGDCVVRSIAIATNSDYKLIYDTLFNKAKDYINNHNNKISRRMNPSPRDGTNKVIYEEYLLTKGWKYISLIKFGSKDRTRIDQLTHLNNIIIHVMPSHLVCMKKGIIHDNWDSRYSSCWDTEAMVVLDPVIKTAIGYFIKRKEEF